jgi:hypothetical protein
MCGKVGAFSRSLPRGVLALAHMEVVECDNVWERLWSEWRTAVLAA